MKNFTLQNLSRKTILATFLVGGCFSHNALTAQKSARTVPFSYKSEQSIASNQKVILDQKFTVYTVYNIDHEMLFNQVQQTGSATFNLTFDGRDYNFVLTPNEVRSPDYKSFVVENGVERELPRGPVKTYKGYVNGDESNVVSMAITENFISASFIENGQTYHLKPVDELTSELSNLDNNYVLYSDNNFNANSISCPLESNNSLTTDAIAENSSSFSAAGAICANADLAVVARQDLYAKYNNNQQATIDFMLSQVAEIASLYTQVGIRHIVTGSKVITDAGVLSATTSNALLQAFTTWGKSVVNLDFKYDVANLFIPNQFGAIAGEANPNSVTKTNKYVWTSQEGGSGTFAHELGHAWGCTKTVTNGTTGGHDTQTTCPDYACVMRTAVPAGSPGISKWSPASQTQLQDYVTSLGNAIRTCANDVPYGLFIFEVEGAPVTSCTGSLAVSVLGGSRTGEVITGWEWDFGDGYKANTKDAKHTYTTNGKFALTLKATNSKGSTTDQKATIFVDKGTVYPNQNVGLATKSTQDLSGLGVYMDFEVFAELTIESIKVYNPKTGPFVYAFGYGKDNVYNSKSGKNLNVAAGPNISTVALGAGRGFQFAPGKYQLWFPETNIPDQLNKETTTPGTDYEIPNVIKIYSASSTAYFAYDWVVKRVGCIGGTIGVNEIGINSNKTTVFPNPSGGTFTVKFGEERNQPNNITVYNVVGKTVYTLNNISTDDVKLNLSFLAAGTYILKVSGATEQNIKISINN